MNTNETERTKMDGTDRVWTVGVSAGLAAAALGLVIALPTTGDARITMRVIGLAAWAVGSIAIGVLAGTVWARIEESIEQRSHNASAIWAQLGAATAALNRQATAHAREAVAAELVAELVADGALSWGAGPALGVVRVRVEYEDEAYRQLGETERRQQRRMRLIQSGLDLLADKIRTGSTLAPGMRLAGNTVQVVELIDDTVLIAIRASSGTYLAVHGVPREDWHAFAVTQVALLTQQRARQLGIALA